MKSIQTLDQFAACMIDQNQLNRVIGGESALASIIEEETQGL